MTAPAGGSDWAHAAPPTDRSASQRTIRFTSFIRLICCARKEGLMTLSLNEPAPPFDLDGVLNGQSKKFRLADHRGRWLVLFFYPSDFTFVCPTEVLGFHKRLSEFKAAGADVAGISVDSLQSHRDWS